MKYFTSDLHLGGVPINSIRPDNWEEIIIDVINSRVGKNDTIYNLGDFCKDGQEQFYRQKFKCKSNFFIYGNHDHRNKIAKAFGQDQCSDYKETKIHSIKTVLSHYCHFIWNQSHRNAFHLYGHTHSLREEYLDKLFPDRRSMDVCPENYLIIHGTYGIFSEDEIYDFLSDRKGHDPIEFYNEVRDRLHAK